MPLISGHMFYLALLDIESLSQHSLIFSSHNRLYDRSPLIHLLNTGFYFFIFYKIKTGKTFFTKINHFNAYFVGL